VDPGRRTRALGLTRVLVACAPDNLGSARTIERVGGAFEAVQGSTVGPLRRHRFAIGDPSPLGGPG
jgi:predicted acetyltransferase